MAKGSSAGKRRSSSGNTRKSSAAGRGASKGNNRNGRANTANEGLINEIVLIVVIAFSAMLFCGEHSAHILDIT